VGESRLNRVGNKREEKSMKAYALALTALAILIAVPAFAQETNALPPSGSFKTHAGFKANGDSVEVAKDHILTGGLAWGVTYNDAGSGPLQMGPAVCGYAIEIIKGAGTGEGECTWSDADGKSKIFTRFSGKISPSGVFAGPDHIITGGTGRYSGIEGRAPFHCQLLNDKGQYACSQDWEYRITKP
jgi:hypothetical protein